MEEYEKMYPSSNTFEYEESKEGKPEISPESIKQMQRYHKDFIKEFISFKKELLKLNQSDTKYLVCRLDFNEYY